LELFCKQNGFEPWLEDALNRIFCQAEATRIQAAGPNGAAPGTIHCLNWCNKGIHRSVSACRSLTFVAGELKMRSCPSCISFFFVAPSAVLPEVPLTPLVLSSMGFAQKVQHVPAVH
jgi:hypothetical protein